MLFLEFQLDTDCYALETEQIVRVLPLVAIKHIPQAPRGIAGAFDFHGKAVPVIDLSALVLGRPAARRLSTRVLLARYRDGAGCERLLGLIAEHATRTLRREPSDFAPSGVTCDAAPYLGPVARTADGLVQWIDVQRLLPPTVCDALFREVEDCA
jgi:chemotaxis-related protein WspB